MGSHTGATSRDELMRVNKLIWKVVVSLCALVATLVIVCAPAGADVTHKYLSSITEVPTEGPNGEPVSLPGPLGRIESMTIDGNDLYAVESSRTDVFDATTHAFVKQFDLLAPPLEGGSFGTARGIAVGHATGSPQVYVGALESHTGAPSFGVVDPLDAEGHQIGHPWTGEDTPNGTFVGHQSSNVPENTEGRLNDIAVDNDATSLLGDWAAGDVFVDTSSEVGGGSVGFNPHPALDVIDIFKPEAGGAEKYQTQLTGTCESPGVCPGKVVPFGRPLHVAVNPQNGDVVVVNEVKGEEGIRNPSTGVVEFMPPVQMLDMFRPGPIPDEYEFVGSLTGSPNHPFHTIQAIAIDSGEDGFGEGTIYVLEGISGNGNETVYQFNPVDQYVGQFSASGVSAAVDPNTHEINIGTQAGVQIFGPSLVLPDVTTEPVSNLAPTSVTLNGTVNPDKANAGQTTCQFVWGTSESFGHAQPCPVPVAEGESPVPVSAMLEGLERDTTYYFSIQASNNNGINEHAASQPLHFTTPGPGMAEESVSSISSTSATFGAKIDPNGASTNYYFEYGTTTGYGTDAPAMPGETIGAGKGYNEEAQHVQGLSPGTTYHYRVVIESELQIQPGVFRKVSFDGSDQTFTTQTVGGALVLPDGRAWELVSPADKHGGIIRPIEPAKEGDLVQASESGDAIFYGGAGPTEEKPQGSAEGGSQIFSKRGPEGWYSQDIMLPHRTATGVAIGHGTEYKAFSDDLSLGLVVPFGEFTSLGPEASPPDTERTPYLRHDNTCDSQPSSCYLPLLTEAPGYADVPPGTVLDPEPTTTVDVLSAQFAGATPDLGHVLLESGVGLSRGDGGGIYEWSSGKPPDEEVQLVTENGRVPGFYKALANLIYATSGTGISEDGSRVLVEEGGHLYQHNMSDGKIVQLDEVQPGALGGGGPNANFQTESGDGSVVYFTDKQNLTSDSIEGDDDLYECRMHEIAGEYKCALTDVVHAASGVSVLGASKDGTNVYFTSSDALSAQAGSDGERAVPGAGNLYELHNGVVRLIAVSNQGLPALVSHDGDYLAFGSERSLTGYDNAGAEELFLFNSTTNRVACVSCNPSGASSGGSSTFPLGGRYLSSNGRLFFDSSEALVPQDINKNVDVYEYEPVGVGDCAPSAATYNEGTKGCVGLISPGTATGESTFMGASENGDDVFFLTQEKLVADDVDTAMDIYDAHVCSMAVPCSIAASAPPLCLTADACRSAPSLQPAVFGSPASATFTGAGNVLSTPALAARPKSLSRAQKLARALATCRKMGKRKRATCEKKARKQYSGKRSRRARFTKGSRG